MIIQQWLARLFTSNWRNPSTVTGMINQQSLARLFSSHWHDCSTVTGTVYQQSLTRLFNSHWKYFSTVTARFFFLCWQNFSTMKITIEESCHVQGIPQMIQLMYYKKEAHFKELSKAIRNLTNTLKQQPVQSQSFTLSSKQVKRFMKLRKFEVSTLQIQQ